MNIQAHRIMASNAWKTAGSLIELSPTAQKFHMAMGGLSLKQSKSWLVRLMANMMEKILKYRLDKLILIEDPSVQLMTIKAMSMINHYSRHVGFIATLYASEEVGYSVDAKGENISSEHVSMQVWRYFLKLLEVKEYLKDLDRCQIHWEGCLKIDYTEEYSVEDRWDFSGDKPVHIHRDVPPEEVAAKIAENKAEVRALYKYDLDRLMEKKLSGYYKKRESDVRVCLDKIFAYIFKEEISEEVIGSVLEMLARIARLGYFPEKWLLEFSGRYASKI